MSKVWDGRSGLLLPDDIAFIRELVGGLPKEPVQVVDLGAGSGTTALAVFSARQKDISVLSVDVRASAIEATRANMAQYGYLHSWQGVVERSDRVSMPWPRMAVDLLLCDSTHDYASQQDELIYWFKELRKWAVVWVHDASLSSAGTYPGVRLAIDEFVDQGRLEPIGERGLGWAGRFVK